MNCSFYAAEVSLAGVYAVSGYEAMLHAFVSLAAGQTVNRALKVWTPNL